MNNLGEILDTSGPGSSPPVVNASRAAYLGLVAVIVFFAFVFWFRARR